MVINKSFVLLHIQCDYYVIIIGPTVITVDRILCQL